MQPGVETTARDLLLELSNNCNLACVMCGFGGERVTPDRFISEELLRRVFEAVLPPRSVRLNGRGESTIHPRFTSLLSRIAVRWPNADLQLFTNLNISRREVLETIIRMDVLLYVSIDSPVKEELEDIRRGADLGLIERNLDVLRTLVRRPYFVFTLQERNLHRVGDMARYAARWRAGLIYNVVRHDVVDHHLANRLLSDYAAVRDAFILAREIMDTHGLPCQIPDQVRGVPLELADCQRTQGSGRECPALDQEACILHNGDVTPCNMFNPFVYGNILEQDYADILSGRRAAEFRATRAKSPYCQNCAWMEG